MALNFSDNFLQTLRYEDESAPTTPDIEKDTMSEAITKGILRGGQQLYEGAGSALQYLGNRIGNADLAEFGKEHAARGREVGEWFEPSRDIAKSYFGEDSTDRPGAKLAYDIANMGVSMAPALIAAGATMGYSLVPPAASRLVASIVGGAIGGMQEGTSTYQEMMKRGAPESDAARGLESMAAGAGILNAISMGKILSKSSGGVIGAIKKGLASGVTEATTEYLEEPLEVGIKKNLLKPEQFTEKEARDQLIGGFDVMPASFVLGALTGGIAGLSRSAPSPPSPTARDYARTPADEKAAYQEYFERPAADPASLVSGANNLYNNLIAKKASPDQQLTGDEQALISLLAQIKDDPREVAKYYGLRLPMRNEAPADPGTIVEYLSRKKAEQEAAKATAQEPAQEAPVQEPAQQEATPEPIPVDLESQGIPTRPVSIQPPANPLGGYPSDLEAAQLAAQNQAFNQGQAEMTGDIEAEKILRQQVPREIAREREAANIQGVDEGLNEMVGEAGNVEVPASATPGVLNQPETPETPETPKISETPVVKESLAPESAPADTTVPPEGTTVLNKGTEKQPAGLNPVFSDIHAAAKEAAKRDNALDTETAWRDGKVRTTEGAGMPYSETRKQWDMAYQEELNRLKEAKSASGGTGEQPSNRTARVDTAGDIPEDVSRPLPFKWNGQPSQPVKFVAGEYAGMTGKVIGQTQKRYSKEADSFTVQVDGFPKPGGWDGKVHVGGEVIAAAEPTHFGPTVAPQGETLFAIKSGGKTFVSDTPKSDANHGTLYGKYSEIIDNYKNGEEPVTGWVNDKGEFVTKAEEKVSKNSLEASKAFYDELKSMEGKAKEVAPPTSSIPIEDTAKQAKTETTKTPESPTIPFGVTRIKESDAPKYRDQLNKSISTAHSSLYDTDTLASSGFYDGTYSIPKTGGLIAAKKSSLYATSEEYRNKIDDAIAAVTETMKRANAHLRALDGKQDTGTFGVSYSIQPESQSEKRRGKFTVDVARAWNMEAKSKYPYTNYLGDVAIREALQNSLDAVLEAKEKKQIKEGKIGIEQNYTDFVVDDNGIGMSDVDIADKFLALHATGKDKSGRFGGFGIAKAVILGPHETATWTLHTRDNVFDNEMATNVDIIGTAPHRQGTRLAVKTSAHIFSDEAKQYAETTEIPKGITITYNGAEISSPFKGLRGKKETVRLSDTTTMDITYYPKSPAGYNKKQVIRLVDPVTASKLTQGIQNIWNDGFNGTIIIDVTTSETPGGNNYPLTDSRMELKGYDTRSSIEKIIEKHSVDPNSAKRAGLGYKWHYAADMASIKSKIPRIENSKSYMDLLSEIDKVFIETGNYYDLNNKIIYTPLSQLRIRIDDGYKGPRTLTEWQAKHLAAYESTVRLYGAKLGLPVYEFYVLFSKPIDGGVVAGEYYGGNMGVNPMCFDKNAMSDPVTYALALRDLATHELTHNYVGKHNEEFTSKLAATQGSASTEFAHTLKIAESATGKESGLTKKEVVTKLVPVEKVVEKTVEKIIELETKKYYTPAQQEFIFDNIERGGIGGNQEELYRPVDGSQPSLFEAGEQTEQRGSNPSTAALGSKTGNLGTRGGNELANTQGNEQVGNVGVGTGGIRNASEVASTKPLPAAVQDTIAMYSRKPFTRVSEAQLQNTAKAAGAEVFVDRGAFGTDRVRVRIGNERKGFRDIKSANDYLLEEIKKQILEVDKSQSDENIKDRFDSTQQLSRSDLQTLANDLLGTSRNRPGLIIVDKPSDLPFDALEDAEGVFYDGKIYLVSSNIPTVEDAKRVIFHELVGHYGLRGFFGNRLDSTLDLIYNNNPLIRQYALDWMKNNRDLQLRYELSDLDYHYRAIEEAMAKMAQQNKPFSFAKRLLSAIQSLLRKVGLNKLADTLEAKSNAEALAILDKSRLYISKGAAIDSKMPSPAFAYFSRAPRKITPKSEKKPRKTLRDITDLEPPHATAPLPTIPPEQISDWMKDNSLYALSQFKQMLPKNTPELSILERLLASPEWYQHPIFRNLVDLFSNQRHDIANKIFQDNEMIDPTMPVSDKNSLIAAAKSLKNKGLSNMDIFRGKSSREYDALKWVITYGDAEYIRNKKEPLGIQMKKFEDHVREKLSKQRFTSAQINEIMNTWQLFRRSYDSYLKLMMAPMIEMRNKIKYASKSEGKETDLYKKLDTDLSYMINQMNSWSGFYAPRERLPGKWVVYGLKGEGDKEKRFREHVGTRFEAEKLKDRYERMGYTVQPITEYNQMPEIVMQNLRQTHITQAIKNAIQSEKAKSKGNQDKIDLLNQLNQGVLNQVADIIQARGYLSSKMTRITEHHITGYIEDPIERYLIYARNTSNGLAKSQVSQTAYEVLRHIDPMKSADENRLYNAASKYIEDNLRNIDKADRAVALAKSAATMKYLALNPRSLLVNATAVATTAPAAIHQYATGGKIGLHKIVASLASAGADFGKFMAGNRNFSKEEQQFLNDLIRSHYDNPQYTMDVMGNLQGSGSKLWNTAMRWGMTPFSLSERWNRGTTMLAAFRLARSQGKSYEEASKLARIASDKAHGIYGKATLPEIAQGTTLVARAAQMMYSYAKFGHNYVQMLYDLGFRKQNLQAFAYALLSPVVLAGGASLPFKDNIVYTVNWILRFLGIKEDSEKWWWDQTRKYLGKEGEKLGRHGIIGYMGADISSSLSINLGIPDTYSKLAGPVGGVAEDFSNVKKYTQTGEYSKAAESVLPNAVTNMLRAYRERQEGVTSRQGRRLWDESGKPFIPTTGQALLRATGFRPSEQAMLQERKFESQRVYDTFKEAHDNILEAIRAYLISPVKNPEKMVRITRQIEKYNQQVTSQGLVDQVPLITRNSIMTQLRGVSAPKKKEAARLRSQTL